MNFIKDEKVRAYIYRILLAVSPIAVFYGLLSEQETVLWVGLAGVVLNILPVMNTSIGGNDGRAEG